MSKSLAVYRALTRLYPKKYRKQYGEQMVQTLEDMLDDQPGGTARLAVWVRAYAELPIGLTSEHINNKGDKIMNKLTRISNRWLIAGAGALVLVIAAAALIIVPDMNNPFSATLAEVKSQASADPPACIAGKNSDHLDIDAQQIEYIGNSVATSIIDVPAGTNVDVFVATHQDNIAKGSAYYDGEYGSYNFVAKKDENIRTDDFYGNWKVADLVVCKR